MGMSLFCIFLRGATPRAGGVADPVVQKVRETTESFEGAQFVVEFAHAGLGALLLAGGAADFFDVSLKGDDAADDADADLGNINPVGGDELAHLDGHLSVVGHEQRVMWGLRVDKHGVW